MLATLGAWPLRLPVGMIRSGWICSTDPVGCGNSISGADPWFLALVYAAFLYSLIRLSTTSRRWAGPGRVGRALSPVVVGVVAGPVLDEACAGCSCAMRRLVVSPTQLGGTRREVPGSDGLPGSER
jgi:hypothetical protein